MACLAFGFSGEGLHPCLKRISDACASSDCGIVGHKLSANGTSRSAHAKWRNGLHMLQKTNSAYDVSCGQLEALAAADLGPLAESISGFVRWCADRR